MESEKHRMWNGHVSTNKTVKSTRIIFIHVKTPPTEANN